MLPWLFRSGGATIALLALLFLILSLSLKGRGAEARILCHAKPPQTDSYVSWRMVDGRKCWYIGRPRMDRELLYWPAPPELPATTGRAAEEKNVPDFIRRGTKELEELPVMGPVTLSFRERWDGLGDTRAARDPEPMSKWKMWERRQ